MGRKPIKSSAQKGKASADAQDPGGSQTSRTASSRSSSSGRTPAKVSKGGGFAEGEPSTGKSKGGGFAEGEPSSRKTKGGGFAEGEPSSDKLKAKVEVSPGVQTLSTDVPMDSPKSESSEIVDRFMQDGTDDWREWRFRRPVDLNEGDPIAEGVATNKAPGNGSLINGRGFPVPNMANFGGPVNGVPEYTGDRGVRTERPSRKMSFRRLVKKETVKADLIDMTDDEMGRHGAAKGLPHQYPEFSRVHGDLCSQRPGTVLSTCRIERAS